MLFWLVLIICLPVLAYQAWRVSNVIPRLPEASGVRRGVTCRGTGNVLSIAAIGDSAGAGVGVTTMQQSLVGKLVAQLSDQYDITWQVEARLGMTTPQMRDRIDNIDGRPEVIITSLGVNDLKQGITIERWIFHLQTMVSALRKRFPDALILLTPLPHLHRFPALPHPLRWVLGKRAIQFNSALLAWAETVHNAEMLPLDIPWSSRFMASDGFHPSEDGYQIWAAIVADRIKARLN